MRKTIMSKTRGTGLLMVWSDVDAEFEAEFNRWYDEGHISRLLQVPGFLSAGRYTAIRGGPKYLAMYELEDVAQRLIPRHGQISAVAATDEGRN
jgi:hypothetical protein